MESERDHVRGVGAGDLSSSTAASSASREGPLPGSVHHHREEDAIILSGSVGRGTKIGSPTYAAGSCQSVPVARLVVDLDQAVGRAVGVLGGRTDSVHVAISAQVARLLVDPRHLDHVLAAVLGGEVAPVSRPTITGGRGCGRKSPVRACRSRSR